MITFVLLCIAAKCNCASLQFVNSNGIGLTENVVDKYFDSELVASDSNLSMLGMIDCTGENKCTFMNKVFQTDFSDGSGEISNIYL